MDRMFRLWDWDNKWQLKQTFEGNFYLISRQLLKDGQLLSWDILHLSVAKANVCTTEFHWWLSCSRMQTHSIFDLRDYLLILGHTHYVMQLVINPKDNNTFATASLDKTIKVWQFGSSVPNFTLEGHEKGVNCVDYYHGGDKPYLISGADDRLVKIWDYQNKTCVATLDGHSHNVSAVCFHPELPISKWLSKQAMVNLGAN